MGLQDLTPQLRTRLSRIERVVGVFVTFATILLLAGFGYYLIHTAQRKGWFLNKAPYFTYVQSAEGLRVGEPVKLMGFDVGWITLITAEAPGMMYNVYIEFVILEPFYGYIWSDSRVKVTAADFLGNRYLEVTKGGSDLTRQPYPTYRETDGVLTHVLIRDSDGEFEEITRDRAPYWLESDESPALTARLEALANQAEQALPQILSLTNQLAAALENAASATDRLDTLLTDARPVVTNLAVITKQLQGPGALGEWLLPTNIHQQLENTLTASAQTLSTTQTNIDMLSRQISMSLENVAMLTSNLNAQVQANSMILSDISELVINADELIQGLRRNWLLRGAFRDEPDPPQQGILNPTLR
jgi:ABC-type transporter Mla subunit MlaD